MNRTTISPAPARTDEPAASSSVVADDTALARSVRLRGYGLAAGAAIWAASIFAVGTNPESSVDITVSDLGALPFQVGVMALLGAMGLTNAIGSGRGARVAVRVERVLLTLATAWTVIHGLFPDLRDAAWLAALDVFWPLSMLGMFLIGIKVAVRGQWRGVARVWPLVAESWAVVSVPVFVIVGAPVSDWVGGGHLLIGYTVLGLILARRTELTLPRR